VISALTVSRYLGNQSSKQIIKGPAFNLPTLHAESANGWIGALATIPALVILGVVLWRLEGDKGWRDQAEGLRERLEREELPRA
jgi:hypothetical protein